MKKISMVLVALVMGCTQPPTPDPDNGVSNASYRLAISRSEKNMAGVLSRLRTAEATDLANPSPVHSKAWWDALVEEVTTTEGFLQATLQGATYTASPTAK